MFSGKIDQARKSLQFVTPGISELAIAEIQVTRRKRYLRMEDRLGLMRPVSRVQVQFCRLLKNVIPKKDVSFDLVACRILFCYRRA